MKILGIETSCDETAVAVVSDRKGAWQQRILAHHVASQIPLHQAHGGVIPEIASRSHLDVLPTLVARCLKEAELDMGDLDGIAVAGGPGLIGGVLVGVMYAKAVAAALDLPFLAVNHLEGHALMPRLTHDVCFPYLLLLMSGGHTQFLLAQDVGRYDLLGTTRDDALGEAFDKVARLLGLAYPGGPLIEHLAQAGDPTAFAFATPLLGQPGCDLSFSGLKTDVARRVSTLSLTPQVRADVCASFQAAVARVLVDRGKRAFQLACQQSPSLETVVLAGGVAANLFLRSQLTQALAPATVIAPPPSLCTDNGVMIGWAGLERFKRGLVDPLGFAPRPRWPLSEVRSCPV